MLEVQKGVDIGDRANVHGYNCKGWSIWSRIYKRWCNWVLDVLIRQQEFVECERVIGS